MTTIYAAASSLRSDPLPTTDAANSAPRTTEKATKAAYEVPDRRSGEMPPTSRERIATLGPFEAFI